MAKQQPKIPITLANGQTADLAPDDKIVIIKASTVESPKTGEPWEHRGATMIYSADYTIVLTLEDGATEIAAGDWAAHLAAESPGLMVLLARGEVAVYRSAVDALAQLPAHALRAAIARTRHGVVLRAWETAEQDSPRPRKVILEGIRERLRCFRDHAPTSMLSLAELAAVKGTRGAVRDARAGASAA